LLGQGAGQPPLPATPAGASLSAQAMAMQAPNSAAMHHRRAQQNFAHPSMRSISGSV
jgi:hypothetical protein